MATFGETEVPLNRYEVMVERWESTIKLSVPAFSQQDAIDRIVSEANEGKYYCFIKAYAPETGGGRREDDNGNNGSSNS